MLADPNETMILSRPFIATIHARIDVFNREISLGVGEDMVVFYMKGNVHHPIFPIKKACIINEIQEEESFNPLEIGDDLFSYDFPFFLEFEIYDHLYETNQNNKNAFVSDDVHGRRERWESGLDKKYYDPPQVYVETSEVKRYSFRVEKSFICVTKLLEDALPLGKENESRFEGMIRKEIDTGGSFQRESMPELSLT
nr:hypothetical protein [Tanacetum cinerariifolium]